MCARHSCPRLRHCMCCLHVPNVSHVRMCMTHSGGSLPARAATAARRTEARPTRPSCLCRETARAHERVCACAGGGLTLDANERERDRRLPLLRRLEDPADTQRTRVRRRARQPHEQRTHRLFSVSRISVRARHPERKHATPERDRCGCGAHSCSARSRRPCAHTRMHKRVEHTALALCERASARKMVSHGMVLRVVAQLLRHGCTRQQWRATVSRR
jgi:hypothetical protein